MSVIWATRATNCLCEAYDVETAQKRNEVRSMAISEAELFPALLLVSKISNILRL